MAHDSDARAKPDAARNLLSGCEWTAPDLFSERQASGRDYPLVGWVMIQVL